MRSSINSMTILFMVMLGMAAGCECGYGVGCGMGGRVASTDVDTDVPNTVGITDMVPTGRNLLMIVVDTLRADRLGCYGYGDPTSVRIDALAQEGIVFERCYASSPWTAPSFASLLTGVSPSVHRCGLWMKDFVPGTVQVGPVRTFPVNPDLLMMARALDDMQSATFASNPFLDPVLGFARGVDYYDQTFKHRRAGPVTDNVIEWLAKHQDDPFFVMLHYMDPHAPYDPLEPYKSRFMRGRPGRIETPFGPSAQEAAALNPTAHELDYIKGLYDGEVAYVDAQLSRLFQHMEKAGLMDNTWIVLTADHGEEHWDHGAFNHGFQYEDEVTRVPLIIRAPGGQWGAGHRVPYSVRLMDVYPTVLEWFDKDVPAYVEAKSLMPLLRNETGHRPCYMEYQLFHEQQHAFFDGRYKLIETRRGTDGYMYDLQNDPLEQAKKDDSHSAYSGLKTRMDAYEQSLKQRYREVQERGARRRRAGKDYRSDVPSDEKPVMSEDAVEALKALGYIQE